MTDKDFEIEISNGMFKRLNVHRRDGESDNDLLKRLLDDAAADRLKAKSYGMGKQEWFRKAVAGMGKKHFLSSSMSSFNPAGALAVSMPPEIALDGMDEHAIRTAGKVAKTLEALPPNERQQVISEIQNGSLLIDDKSVPQTDDVNADATRFSAKVIDALFRTNPDLAPPVEGFDPMLVNNTANHIAKIIEEMPQERRRKLLRLVEQGKISPDKMAPIEFTDQVDRAPPPEGRVE